MHPSFGNLFPYHLMTSRVVAAMRNRVLGFNVDLSMKLFDSRVSSFATRGRPEPVGRVLASQVRSRGFWIYRVFGFSGLETLHPKPSNPQTLKPSNPQP